MNYTTPIPTRSGDPADTQDTSAMPQAQGEVRRPPLHIRLPDVGRHQSATEPSRESSATRSPTFDGVDAVLDQGENVVTQSGREKRRTRHSSHGKVPSYGVVSYTKTDATGVVGASWRPVVLLILILLAAAGMTLWITVGPTWTSPTSSNDSMDPATWSSVSEAEQLAEDCQTPDMMVTPLGWPDVPRDEARGTAWPGSTNAVEVALPAASRSMGHHASPTPYPTTGCEGAWQPSPPSSSGITITSSDGANTTPSTVVAPVARQAQAPVSFEGHVETPNLRARHDRQRSSLH